MVWVGSMVDLQYYFYTFLCTVSIYFTTYSTVPTPVCLISGYCTLYLRYATVVGRRVPLMPLAGWWPLRFISGSIITSKYCK